MLTLHHNKFTYLDYFVFFFFCFLHTVGFRSIFTFILSFRKNKYQIHSYTTSNMDDFKTICIYENLPIFAYFFKRLKDFSRLLKKNPTFSNIFLCAKHILNTFKLRMLCARFYIFIVCILFAPVILISIHRCVNNFPDIKVLMMVIETKTFNINFTSQ